MSISTSPNFSRLNGQGLRIGYQGRVVCDGIDVRIPDGGFTVIVGPNGCGKSTLLRSLCRLIRPSAGQVALDGKDVQTWASKALARELGLLPQSAIAPDGITVFELVARGRYPHQGLLRQWSRADEEAVQAALAATGVADLAERPVDHLSGGQRQRVWVAMTLAQQSSILLLDEPTTFLDIAHQIDLLDLFCDLNQAGGHTIVAVLHDLNHACRYASHLIAMRDGKIVAQGAPREIITAALVQQVFGLACMVIDDPVSHTPLVIPHARHRAPKRAAA